MSKVVNDEVLESKVYEVCVYEHDYKNEFDLTETEYVLGDFYPDGENPRWNEYDTDTHTLVAVAKVKVEVDYNI